ncbi:Fumarylacetoacetase [Chlorella vulgaris]
MQALRALVLAREPLAAAGIPALRSSLQGATAPLANALLSVGGSSSGWRLGFHSSSAQHHAVDAQQSSAANGDGQPQQQQGEETVDATASMTPEQVVEAYREAQEALEAERKRADELKDKLLRTLADMENLRDRTARTTAETKQFAVQGLVKNLLEVADNLERAAGSVPPADVDHNSDIDRERALMLLRSLREGVLMTDAVLMKVLGREGVSRYDPLGDKFDPNLHNALFEVPDATKDPGTVAVVVKRGYSLHERIVRAAEVGVEPPEAPSHRNGEPQHHHNGSSAGFSLGLPGGGASGRTHLATPTLQVVSGSGWWEAAGLQKAAATALAAAASSNGNGNGLNPGAPPLLEFVVTDGLDTWDKPADGSNYAITAPGRWSLNGGSLAAATAPAVLVCSDLDDTMVGDDEATAAFSTWWQAEAVPAGGRLVYNTGRALDLFEQLLGEKGGCMAEPDMLVSAIGTRIYVKQQGRWVEDEAFTASLGQGWQLEGVGKDAMHFRPPSEMSEHKVTCGVRLDVLDGVLAGIKRELADGGVRHRIVVSGSGDWRFLDLVPVEAGKLQALEYARRTLGFAPEQTVACGDSGNDIDMLEGRHRSIVVGNAHPVLLEWAEARQRSLAGGAQGGELLVTAAHRAHGILEGLRSFGFIHFSLRNLPYGIFSTAANPTPRPGVAIGAHVLDLAALSSAGLFSGPLLSSQAQCFQQTTLNSFMALGRPAWVEARQSLQRLLAAGEGALRDNAELRERALVPMHDAAMHLPAAIGGYTDFYCSREHATNVGIMFRGKDNALQPNWLHLPVGYHGRASSVVVSGTPVRRPWGQVLRQAGHSPAFQPSGQLDFELEMGCLVGPGNELGSCLSVGSAADHIFGYVLVNDWSARDIQKWEYVPLGPFNSKNFATSISPWVVTPDALAPFECEAPPQDPPPLPYLQQPQGQRRNYDVRLEVAIQPGGGGGGGSDASETVVTRSNLRTLYWTLPQMMAHHTAGGCNLRPGDLIATGTLSCEGPQGAGCLLEATWNGSQPVQLSDGSVRHYLLDGDTVIMRGYCQAEDGQQWDGQLQHTESSSLDNRRSCASAHHHSQTSAKHARARGQCRCMLLLHMRHQLHGVKELVAAVGAPLQCSRARHPTSARNARLLLLLHVDRAAAPAAAVSRLCVLYQLLHRGEASAALAHLCAACCCVAVAAAEHPSETLRQRQAALRGGCDGRAPSTLVVCWQSMLEAHSHSAGPASQQTAVSVTSCTMLAPLHCAPPLLVDLVVVCGVTAGAELTGMTSICDGREPWMTSTREELSRSGGAPVERKFGILAGLADHSASAQGADQHRSLPAGARAATVLKAVSRVTASADERQEVLLAALRVAAMTAYGHAVEFHGVQTPSKRAARLNTDHCRFQRRVVNVRPAAGKVVELQTDAEYESALKELSAEKSAAMFDFGAAWCGPCKMIAPVFDGLAAEFPSIRFFKVDIDNDQLSKTVAENSVAAVPTFVSYVGADRHSTFSGADKAMLRKMAMELSAK